jgi:hypothetical protein
VLVLFLFALALSIVLKPRGQDKPQELSGLGGSSSEHGDRATRRG